MHKQQPATFKVTMEGGSNGYMASREFLIEPKQKGEDDENAQPAEDSGNKYYFVEANTATATKEKTRGIESARTLVTSNSGATLSTTQGQGYGTVIISKGYGKKMMPQTARVTPA